MNAMLKLAMKEGHKKGLPVSVRKKTSGNTSARKTADERRAEILEMLSHRGLTAKQMAKKIGCDERITHERILYLRDKGKIICTGQTKRVGTISPSKIWGLVP